MKYYLELNDHVSKIKDRKGEVLVGDPILDKVVKMCVEVDSNYNASFSASEILESMK